MFLKFFNKSPFSSYIPVFRMSSKTIGKINFGSIDIPFSQIFLLRTHVFALINIRPLSPGHVMVVTRRVVKKLSALTETESLELWCTVQEVSTVMEQIHKVYSF